MTVTEEKELRDRVRRMEGLLDSQLKLQVEALNARGPKKPCDHFTLRRPDLPCPHPQCTTLRGPVLVTAKIADTVPRWYSLAEKFDPMAPNHVQEYWRRDELHFPDGQRFWAWRPG